MTVSTILSRRARETAKSLTTGDLKDKVEYCRKLAIQWMAIPQGTQQASKYWDAVSFYENLLEKKYE